MKSKLKKRKIIIIVCILLVIALIGMLIGLFYILFMKKDYTFYMGNDIKTIESVELIVGGSENTETRRLMIYDKEVIDSILEKMGEYKLKPYYPMGVDNTLDKFFSITVYGEEKKQWYYITSFTNTKCTVDVGLESKGEIDDGIKSWIGMTSISKADGESLYEFVTQVVEDNAKTIEISHIKEFGENKEYDWNLFKQFTFVEVEDMGRKVRDGFEAEEVAKFEIKGKNAFLYVWFYEGTIAGQDSYWLVCDAMIYDEEGNSISIYDEKLDEFLEKLK